MLTVYDESSGIGGTIQAPGVAKTPAIWAEKPW